MGKYNLFWQGGEMKPYKTGMLSGFLAAIALIMFGVVPGEVYAGIVINSATLDGASSVTVASNTAPSSVGRLFQ